MKKSIITSAAIAASMALSSNAMAKASISDILQSVGTVLDGFYSIEAQNLNTATADLAQLCTKFKEESGLVTVGDAKKPISAAECNQQTGVIKVTLDVSTDIPQDIRGMSFTLTPKFTKEDGSQTGFTGRDSGSDPAADRVHDSAREISSWACAVTAKKKNADMKMVGGQTVNIFSEADAKRLESLPADKKSAFVGVLGIYCSGNVTKA